jgi:biopolymer transport protein ExbD
MKHFTRTDSTVHLGFQIAPMIDVVFVIMLFFMIMAGAVKNEQYLGLQLPGIETPSFVKMPSAEITLRIAEDGSVALNDEILGAAKDQRLVALMSSLNRLQQQSNALHDPLLVTLQADEQASYQRIMDALDCLSRAGISKVTFAVGGDEG